MKNTINVPKILKLNKSVVILVPSDLSLILCEKTGITAARESGLCCKPLVQ